MPSILIHAETAIQATRKAQQARAGHPEPKGEEQRLERPAWAIESLQTLIPAKKFSFDRGRPGQPGFEGRDHYHRLNPNPSSKRESNLDVHGNPVPRGSKRSHIIPGESS